MICSNSSIIPPILILKGNVLLKKYFKNDLENDMLLATSLMDYTNKYLAMKYLIHFHNCIFKKTKGQWWILIFNGHGSHVSKEFLLYCWQYKILLF